MKLCSVVYYCLVFSAFLLVSTQGEENDVLDRDEYSDLVNLDKREVSEGSTLVRRKRFLGAVGSFLGGGGGALLGGVANMIGGIFGGGASRDDAEQAARHYDAQMKIQLQELCLSICVTEWEPWEVCSQPCGGGVQKRQRYPNIIGQCKTLSNFVCPYRLNQTQACNSGCPHGGTPDASVQGCRCPDGKRGRCCETEIICDYPGKPGHGRAQGVWPAKYRSMVTFTCNEGYVLVGREQLTCGKDGRWDGQVPVCQRVLCTMPQQNDHVQILNPQEGYNFNDEVLYRCDDGYEIRGSERRACRMFDDAEGRWSGVDPTCLPVDCGQPDFPENGEMTGSNFKYGDVVTYTCNRGYHLSGSRELKCMASGRWLGRIPTCEIITCDQPFKPKNGEIYMRRLTFGTLVSFECHPGYNLLGSRVLQCTGEGEWNGTEPTCTAAVCDNPGVPLNGAKDGSVYYYPHNVTYSCFNGYVLRGARKLTCQSDGTWSSAMPLCEACPENTYMEGSSTACVPCPPDSHTVTPGSTQSDQCICDVGYYGPPGGPCTEIQCPTLKAPGNGTMAPCDTSVGAKCSFQCKDGYILDHGASIRTCQESGNWDGKEPGCSPCLFNTYKSNSGSCLPCPLHSHTNDIAQLLSGCKCDPGFSGPDGGPCEDVNECEDNDGHGPCQDTCENTIGSYRCGCSIPGYVIDPKNNHNCVVDKQCQNLTRDEAPQNGGLVCHWYYEENSQQCAAKCDAGYEFPSRINAYETCGPTTGFSWTFQQEDPSATFHPCVEEFFPGYRTEASSSYFVRACEELNSTEQAEVMVHFKQVLDENGVCQKRATKVCEIKDMAIICGRRTLRRRRRGIEEELSSVDMAFNINAFKIKDKVVDCPQICRFLRIPDGYCSDLCLPTYKRFLRAAVEYAKQQLETVYREQKDRMKFEAAQREFEPEDEGLHMTEVISECKEGHREVDDNCVPCERGTYYSKEINNCIPCPVGTYQLFEGQTVCSPCPEGFAATQPGSLYCTSCTGRTWGAQCNQTCDCVHGLCHPVTGDCICKSGWEGELCDTDTPGCREGTCYDGVICRDVPAPGSGFQCDPCPPGLTGDGQICSPLRYVNEL